MSEIRMLLDEIRELKRRLQALETRQEHPGFAASDVARLSADNTFTGAVNTFDNDVDVDGDLALAGDATITGTVQAAAAWIPGVAVSLNAKLYCGYNGDEPFETDYTGSSTGQRGQVGTVTGGVIYRPGKFGKAVQVAEVATNLIVNPSMEGTGTGSSSGWFSSWSDTITASAEQALYGKYSLKIASDGTVSGTGAFRDVTGLTAGQPYTVSAWFYVPSSWTSLDPLIYVYDGATFIGQIPSSTVTERDEWVRRSVTITPTGTIVRVLFWGQSGAPAAGIAFYVDGIQLEQKAYATPYCDGSLGAGHTWSGTAHASTSSRTAASVRYSTPMSGETGTVMGWFRPSKLRTYRPASTDYDAIFECNYGSGGPLLTLQYPSGSDAVLALYGLSAGTVGLSQAWTPDADTWGFFAITWDGTTTTIYGMKDGDSELAVNSTAQSAGRTFGTDLADVGHWGTLWQLNGLIDDFVILSRAASADEIRAIYESQSQLICS